MKRAITILLSAALMLSMAACGGSSAKPYDNEVQLALRTLEDVWAQQFSVDNGTIIIKDTRVIVLNENYLENIADSVTVEYPSDVLYIVEFILSTNYRNISYDENSFCENTTMFNTVLIYKDGHAEMKLNLIQHLVSTSYILDLSGIIQDVIELGSAYNQTIEIRDTSSGGVSTTPSSTPAQDRGTASLENSEHDSDNLDGVYIMAATETMTMLVGYEFSEDSICLVGFDENGERDNYILGQNIRPYEIQNGNIIIFENEERDEVYNTMTFEVKSSELLIIDEEEFNKYEVENDTGNLVMD